MTFDAVRELALRLPGVEESTSYGTPAFKVKGKFMGRLREDGQSMVFKVGFDRRDILMSANPETFYSTDHYSGYPSVLVRLPRVRPAEMRDLLMMAWWFVAPKTSCRARPTSTFSAR